MDSILRLPSPIPFHDLFFILIHTTIDSMAIILNIILFIAIVFRSPASLRSYAVFLVNCALIDLAAAISSLMIMIRLIPVGDMVAYVYDGPCVAVSGKPLPQSHVLLVCLIVALPTVASMTPFLFSLDDNNAVRNALAIAKPEYVMDEYHVEGHLNIYNWVTLFAIVAISTPAIPAIVVVIVLRAKVLSKIHEKSRNMSEKTMRMHSTLTMVLSMQAVLPVFFIASVANYLVCQLNLMVCTPFQEHMMMQSASFIPLLSPAITLYYVKPYRPTVCVMLMRPSVTNLSRRTIRFITGSDSNPSPR